MHKKVELTELFYDLVFVYAISQMTEFIHHLHHGVIPLANIYSGILALVILVNTWMIETIFTNRYGSNSLLDIGFMVVNMGAMLYLANTFTVEDAARNYLPFVSVVGVASLTLLLQYIVCYKRTNDLVTRQTTKGFIGILSFRLVMIVISLFLPFYIGVTVFATGIALSTFYPLFQLKQKEVTPVDFPHLLERVTLLVIIMFGEMIISVAPTFTINSFNIYSVLLLLIIVALFFFYIIEFDHVIDEKQKNISGYALIYLHYPIFMGISMVTVSLTFLHEAQLENSWFVIGFLYTGLAIFYLAILAHKGYNKASHSYSKALLAGLCLTYSIGLLLSLVFRHDAQALIVILFVLTFLMADFFLVFNVRRMAKNMGIRKREFVLGDPDRYRKDK
ncbi:low temperature requirement protein A [Streptococcus dentapri]|uniref:Low temperature requirement protein A n=1 Tax=Streptococcus dentapri TaxID=573564 RepID=A0ABV8D070_9STRE